MSARSVAQLWVSEIQYAVNPADRAVLPIYLGLAAEVQLPGVHLVGGIVRSRLEPAELGRLDELARELLAAPFSLIERDIRAALPETPPDSPGILRSLLAASDLCLRFLSPTPRPVRVSGHSFEMLNAQVGRLHRDLLHKYAIRAALNLASELDAARPIALRHDGETWASASAA